MKILLVDDSLEIVQSLKRRLSRKFEIDTAVCGAAALELADQRGPYDAVVSDLWMPQMSGLDLLAHFKLTFPETKRLLFTGDPVADQLLRAIADIGIHSLLLKPVEADVLGVELSAIAGN